ncbi:putative 28S ribosomal protein S5, mitochondrial isoform X2 [Apis mellifera]|uniref:Small ribosomal subunit protein uS5m n=1 Tax=Apis mellifera TaxID=7460 RepID=A0A7M7R849_APIME|nr:putative 28S ribosomal protein S5, mitochondrial isoform X2 [Apis mellifera]|eukprot:XP_394577.3 putative 28S ribosomal protein S5, mitochondrial isoform X2 [Apis mellifera]
MMTGGLFRVCKTFTNCIKNINVTNNAISGNLLLLQNVSLKSTRNASFLNKRSASELWKSVISVSNAGKRRGRGRTASKAKDLNKTQKIGFGKIPIIFPGFNSNIILGDTTLQQRPFTEQEKLNYIQEQETKNLISTTKRNKLHPLLRGWSGGQPGGRRLGPPSSDESFKGFETWILYCNHTSIMTSNMGRTKRCRLLVITGNRKGLAGFVMLSGSEFKSTVNAAKVKAGQRLIYVERHNDHTVLHDFFSQFGNTKIFVEQRPKGHGLQCHRVIRTCCEAVGITDLFAKIEGSNNVSSIVKAFFIGLLQQKTYDQIVKEKGLHLVEMRKENNYFPTVLASPTVVRDSSEISPTETLDFKNYVMNGRIPLRKKVRLPFYTKLPSWLIHLRKQERHRDQDKVIIRLRAEYGDICSFLTEKYPEARPSKWRKHDKKKEETT